MGHSPFRTVLRFSTAILCLLSGIALYAQSPDNRNLSAQVDEVVRDQIREQIIPVVSLAVMRDGKIIKAAGYGFANLELKVPVAPEMLLKSGSRGGKNSYIATLVERHSRFLMLIKVRSKETEAVVTALSQHVRKLPATLKRSLTWDRGLEMAKHKDFTVATDVQVYFCDPQSPWQRGSNENTNLLLRQYFPRGTDLSPISQAQLDQVSLRLNQRPRKTLGFHTPASKLHASVASTV